MAHYAMAVCALTKEGQQSVRRTRPYPFLDQSLSISLLQSIGCKLRVTAIICSNMTKAKVKDVIIAIGQRCYSLRIININSMYTITFNLTAQRSGLARWTSDPKVVGSNPIVVVLVFVIFQVSLSSFLLHNEILLISPLNSLLVLNFLFFPFLSCLLKLYMTYQCKLIVYVNPQNAITTLTWSL